MSGVYFRKDGAWRNANDDLNVRLGDSLNSPTTSNVPRVYVRKDSSWKQIYPASSQEQKPISLQNGSGYKVWQGSTSDYPIWGWAMGNLSNSSNDTSGGQGYFGWGVYEHEKNVFKEYAGWMGLTRTAVTKAGYKGLGKVTKVKKLTLVFDFMTFVTSSSAGEYVGSPSYSRKIGLIGTNVNAPSNSTASSANPTVSSNRSSICFSDQSRPANSRAVTFTWTSRSACEMIKDFLNGEYKNICTYSGSRPKSGNHVQTNQYVYTFDYCKYSNVKFSLEYEYEL